MGLFYFLAPRCRVIQAVASALCTRATHVESALLGAPQPSTPLSCGWHHWLFWCWPKLRTPNIFTIRPDSTVEVWIMPTAQEIRAYLEHHGIQTALNAAVNAAIQAQAPNALEFIGDLLKAQAGGAASSAGRPATAATDAVSGAVAAIPTTALSDAEKDAAAAMIQNAAATTGVSAEKLAAAALIQNAAAGDNSQAEKDAAAAMIQNAAATTGVSAEKIAAAALIQNAAAGDNSLSEKDAAAMLIQNAAA